MVPGGRPSPFLENDKHIVLSHPLRRSELEPLLAAEDRLLGKLLGTPSHGYSDVTQALKQRGTRDPKQFSRATREWSRSRPDIVGRPSLARLTVDEYEAEQVAVNTLLNPPAASSSSSWSADDEDSCMFKAMEKAEKVCEEFSTRRYRSPKSGKRISGAGGSGGGSVTQRQRLPPAPAPNLTSAAPAQTSRARFLQRMDDKARRSMLGKRRVGPLEALTLSGASIEHASSNVMVSKYLCKFQCKGKLTDRQLCLPHPNGVVVSFGLCCVEFGHNTVVELSSPTTPQANSLDAQFANHMSLIGPVTRIKIGGGRGGGCKGVDSAINKNFCVRIPHHLFLSVDPKVRKESNLIGVITGTTDAVDRRTLVWSHSHTTTGRQLYSSYMQVLLDESLAVAPVCSVSHPVIEQCFIMVFAKIEVNEVSRLVPCVAAVVINRADSLYAALKQANSMGMQLVGTTDTPLAMIRGHCTVHMRHGPTEFVPTTWRSEFENIAAWTWHASELCIDEAIEVDIMYDREPIKRACMAHSLPVKCLPRLAVIKVTGSFMTPDAYVDQAVNLLPADDHIAQLMFEFSRKCALMKASELLAKCADLDSLLVFSQPRAEHSIYVWKCMKDILHRCMHSEPVVDMVFAALIRAARSTHPHILGQLLNKTSRPLDQSSDSSDGNEATPAGVPEALQAAAAAAAELSSSTGRVVETTNEEDEIEYGGKMLLIEEEEQPDSATDSDEEMPSLSGKSSHRRRPRAKEPEASAQEVLKMHKSPDVVEYLELPILDEAPKPKSKPKALGRRQTFTVGQNQHTDEEKAGDSLDLSPLPELVSRRASDTNLLAIESYDALPNIEKVEKPLLPEPPPRNRRRGLHSIFSTAAIVQKKMTWEDSFTAKEIVQVMVLHQHLQSLVEQGLQLLVALAQAPWEDPLQIVSAVQLVASLMDMHYTNHSIQVYGNALLGSLFCHEKHFMGLAGCTDPRTDHRLPEPALTYLFRRATQQVNDSRQAQSEREEETRRENESRNFQWLDELTCSWQPCNERENEKIFQAIYKGVNPVRVRVFATKESVANESRKKKAWADVITMQRTVDAGDSDNEDGERSIFQQPGEPQKLQCTALMEMAKARWKVNMPSGIVQFDNQNVSDVDLLMISFLCARFDPDLIEVSLQGNQISAKGCPFILSFAKLQYRFRHLKLADNRLGDSGAELLAPLCDTLKVLDLSGNNIGNMGISSVADILKMSASMQEINLSRNAFTDVGCSDICLACKLNLSILTVTLEDNNITDPGAFASSLVLENSGLKKTTLQHLSFDGCWLTLACQKTLTKQMAKARERVTKAPTRGVPPVSLAISMKRQNVKMVTAPSLSGRAKAEKAAESAESGS